MRTRLQTAMRPDIETNCESIPGDPCHYTRYLSTIKYEFSFITRLYTRKQNFRTLSKLYYNIYLSILRNIVIVQVDECKILLGRGALSERRKTSSHLGGAMQSKLSGAGSLSGTPKRATSEIEFLAGKKLARVSNFSPGEIISFARSLDRFARAANPSSR